MATVVTLEGKNTVSFTLESRADSRLWDDAIATWDDTLVYWDSKRTNATLEAKNVVSLTLEPKN